MTAYMVAQVTVTDPEQYKKYAAQASVATTKFGGHYIARGGESLALENIEDGKRFVIIEFPDLDSAQTWYDSPEYEEAKTLRASAATGQFFAVSGC